jgi:hypothetical protein
MTNYQNDKIYKIEAKVPNDGLLSLSHRTLITDDDMSLIRKN